MSGFYIMSYYFVEEIGIFKYFDIYKGYRISFLWMLRDNCN